jgi:hypothetical protein
VLLGAPTPGLGDVVVMGLTPPYPGRSFSGTQPEGQFGVGVAAGHLGGGADPEFVVLSGSALHVYVDGVLAMDRKQMAGAADPCPIDFSSNLPEDARLNRAVMVENLLASGTQIAVGTPATSGAGHVSVFDFDATTGTFTCAALLTGMEPHFGRAMTLVDIDGDGTRDRLLVGAPPTRAYLYTLPLSDGATAAAMATEMMAGGAFGSSVAAFDIDGKPGDEMFIGNPDGTVDGTTTAGRVSVYTGASMTLLAPTAAFPNPLAQHEPGAGDGYGLSVGGVTFCPGTGADGGAATCTKLPLVGSRSRVYTYFTLKKPDPRVR